jgi:uncharacterized alkaline shock family protein YloU
MTGMEGHSVISPEVLARYAADAALEVPGVAAVVEGPRHRQRVRVSGRDVEVHVTLDWGAVVPDVAAGVQEHVGSYLERMAGVRPAAVHVVVEDVARPSAR